LSKSKGAICQPILGMDLINPPCCNCCNAWRRGHESDKYPVNSYVDVAYTISMDEWMGRKGITLVAEDIKLSD
jgi:hypothetical protein